MAFSLLPTQTEVAAFTDLDSVRHWAGLDATAWSHLNQVLGTFTHIRMMAALPASTFKLALHSCRIPQTGGEPRSLSAAEMIQAGLMWRACRVACGLEDIDPLADPPATAPSTGVVTVDKGLKKIKVLLF